MTLHIVSFDVPFPANYGGVIDVYHKLRCLKKENVDVILHCFEYGRGTQNALNDLAREVHYYPRKKGILQQFSFLPFIVKSRTSEALVERLLEDTYPILLEGLHTTSLLNDKRLTSRVKIFRESNIEHDYYRGLAKAERNLLKKLYFYLEAWKLERYEKNLSKSTQMLIVSEEETKYFKLKFPRNKVDYLPSFHTNDEITVKIEASKSPFVLFHGNLSVQENELAYYAFEKAGIFDLPYTFVVAGLNPSEELKKNIQSKKQIQFYDSPDELTMQKLLHNAHIHLLYTDQPTGLKLKLLNVLYAGKFIISNENMLVGTGSIRNLVHVATNMEVYKEFIHALIKREFDTNELVQRKETLHSFDNATKTKQLIHFIETLTKK